MDYKNPLDDEKRKQIDALVAQRWPDFSIEQIQGQRLFRSKEYESLPKPGKGCEVFIGRLPRNCYEDELLPLFEKFGPIFQMRLMMDFSGTNRGYAFIQFNDHKSAKNAAKMMDRYELRGDHSIGVMLSWEKTRLFVGGIPKYKKEKDVLKEMKRVTDGVKSIILYMSVYNNKNRGFCFVEYESHYEAMMAKSRMIPGFKLWRNHEVRVDWADPEPEVDEEIMNQVRVLHIRNLGINVEETDLKNIFSFDDLHVERVKKIRDFAFIHYETREDTEIAYRTATDPEFFKTINGQNMRRIQVSYARPQRPKSQRKKSVSECESQPSGAETPIKLNEHYLQSSPCKWIQETPVDQELKRYQNMYQNCVDFQSSQLPLNPYIAHQSQQLVPKYDSGVNDKINNNCIFIYWVPFFCNPYNTLNVNKQLMDTPFVYNSDLIN